MDGRVDSLPVHQERCEHNALNPATAQQIATVGPLNLESECRLNFLTSFGCFLECRNSDDECSFYWIASIVGDY